MELINELECAGHNVSRVKQKKALLCGLPDTYDVNTEHILGGDYSFEDAVESLIVRESRLLLPKKRTRRRWQCVMTVPVKMLRLQQD